MTKVFGIVGDPIDQVRSPSVFNALFRERNVDAVMVALHVRPRDLAAALEKIGECFAVRTLMLEGGGAINGGLLRAGLIDEVSLLLAPVAEGRVGTPALFDVDGDGVAPHRLALESVERRADDVIWLRYRVAGSDA